MQQIKILFYKMNTQISSWFKRTLASAGYTLTLADPGVSITHAIRRYQPDLVLVDDLEHCVMARQCWSDLPIVIASLRGETPQIIQALDQGADDYITLPFAREECAARIRALLRRTLLTRSSSTNEEKSLLSADAILRSYDDSIILNTATHRVLVDQREVHLTKTEFSLLHCFLLHPGSILSSQMLLRTIWGPEYGEEREYVHVYIRRLRQKLELDPARPHYICSKPGSGYGFLLVEHL